jgi:hypothetical protein
MGCLESDYWWVISYHFFFPSNCNCLELTVEYPNEICLLFHHYHDSFFSESKIRVVVDQVNQTWLDFKRDKSLKKLSHNEQQIHRFEK